MEVSADGLGCAECPFGGGGGGAQCERCQAHDQATC